MMRGFYVRRAGCGARRDRIPHMSGPSRPLEPEPQELEAQTRAVADFVLAHLRTLDAQPSFDLDGVEELRASFREPAPEAGRPLSLLLARLAPAIAKSYNTAGPGYLAYIPGGGVYASALGPARPPDLRAELPDARGPRAGGDPGVARGGESPSRLTPARRPAVLPRRSARPAWIRPWGAECSEG
jgi:hypothetical protein